MSPVLEQFPADVVGGEKLKVFSTTRQGGVSEGNYASFNINCYCGDRPENVAVNRRLLAEELGVEVENIIMPHQTHGTEVRFISKDFLTLPLSTRDRLLEGVDAVFTDLPMVCVGVSTADCIPIVLYDPCNHLVCAVHAGWRGTVHRIVAKSIKMMDKPYRVSPASLYAWIGPGITLDAFEVGEEVYQQFASAGFDMNAIARRYPSDSSSESDGCKWHIDLMECNRRQLVESGLKESHIYVSGICTYNNADRYFSARRLGIDSGRIYTGAVMYPSV